MWTSLVGGCTGQARWRVHTATEVGKNPITAKALVEYLGTITR
jgi:hypothetical protein